MSFDEELAKLRENTAALAAASEAAQLELKKLVHKQERCAKEKKDSSALVRIRRVTLPFHWLLIDTILTLA